MSDANTNVPAGKLICFSSGEYSDYGYNGHFLLLEELTPEKVQAAREEAEALYKEADDAQDMWRSEEMDGPYPHSVSKHGAFMAALIKAGVLMLIDCHEIHLGSYGDLDV